MSIHIYVHAHAQARCASTAGLCIGVAQAGGACSIRGSSSATFGEGVVFKVAFKPTSTIGKKQNTVTRDGEEKELRARGRHDPCVVPRAVPMVESMAALVLADHLLQHFAQCCILPGGELTNVAGVIEPVDVTSEHYERVAARKAEEEAQAAADAAKGEEWGAAAAP